MKSQWTTTDRVFCGIFYVVVGSAIALQGIAAFIEACRSRPKIQVLAFGFKKQDDKAKVEAVGAQESQPG